MPWIILGTIISYLLGSIPFAYIFGRLLKGIDIRQCGSGNVGATNVFRVLGKKPALIVLLLDIFKGFVALVFVGDLVSARSALLSEELLRVILGFAAIAGHNWTIFLKFKGGKGVATTIGVLLGLAVKIQGMQFVLIFVIATWLVVFLFSRLVSFASLIAAVLLPLYMLLLNQSLLLLVTSIVLAAFVVIRHKSNLTRIIQGKEKKLF